MGKKILFLTGVICAFLCFIYCDDVKSEEDTQDLGTIVYTEAPKVWTINVPKNYTKVEVGVYPYGSSTVNMYGGWNGWLKVNDQYAWKFERFEEGKGGIIFDYAKNENVNDASGKGAYYDVTRLVKAGENKIAYSHYGEGPGMGVKIRISTGEDRATQPEATPPARETSSQPSLMEKAVGKSHAEAVKEYQQQAEKAKAKRMGKKAFNEIDDAFPSTVSGLERRANDKDEWGRRFATYVASDTRMLTNEEVIKGLKIYAIIPDHIMVTIYEDVKRTAPISPDDWKNKAQSAIDKYGGTIIYVDDFPVIYKAPYSNPKASVEFDLDYYNISILGSHRYANEEELKKAAKDMIGHFLKVAK